MAMTTAVIVNIALGAIVFAGIIALAAWGIRTGERDDARHLRAPRRQPGAARATATEASAWR